MTWTALAAMLIALSVPPLAAAADWSLAGDPAGQVVTVGRAHVPLPPGDWKELGSVLITAPQTGGELSSSNIRQKLFVQTNDDRVVGAILLSSNDEAASNFWTRPAESARQDVLYSESKQVSGHSYDYLLVNHYVWSDPARDTGLVKQLSTFTVGHGGNPAVWLGATIALTSRSDRDIVRVLVLRNVAADGFDEPHKVWRQSDWHHANIGGARRAYADRFIAWARAYHQAVFDAMRS